MARKWDFSKIISFLIRIPKKKIGRQRKWNLKCNCIIKLYFKFCCTRRMWIYFAFCCISIKMHKKYPNPWQQNAFTNISKLTFIEYHKYFRLWWVSPRAFGVFNVADNNDDTLIKENNYVLITFPFDCFIFKTMSRAKETTDWKWVQYLRTIETLTFQQFQGVFFWN